MSIGNNIRKIRTKSKKTQQEIADLLGVERNTYANWESETNDIKSEYLPKLSEIFNVEIKDLFEDKEKINIVNNSTNYDSSSGGNSFVINITDKDSAEKLVVLVEKLLKKLDKE
ncbi:helix-turn-helix domain-containing protein [Chryseobacterium aquaticum]|uniref:HTH cro/C1-type domain-containing protein n=1 Tax=Chryseobacterium aquaticum subsp. greenlandense TaxID=345663 RepID=A0A101CIW2_9FLAO|nr:helix-turn-helix transcriptional regulator [Chryseobacterium aquaticum]KUJ57067.1 hypothetical protein AR686_05215 [Chryseobacterium aquaticum subsp. greenlandense]